MAGRVGNHNSARVLAVPVRRAHRRVLQTKMFRGSFLRTHLLTCAESPDIYAEQGCPPKLLPSTERLS